MVREEVFQVEWGMVILGSNVRAAWKVNRLVYIQKVGDLEAEWTFSPIGQDELRKWNSWILAVAAVRSDVAGSTCPPHLSSKLLQHKQLLHKSATSHASIRATCIFKKQKYVASFGFKAIALD